MTQTFKFVRQPPGHGLPGVHWWWINFITEVRDSLGQQYWNAISSVDVAESEIIKYAKNNYQATVVFDKRHSSDEKNNTITFESDETALIFMLKYS